MLKINSNLKKLLKSILVLALFGFSIQALATWVQPSAIPPNGNTPSPVHVGSDTQYKVEGLVLGGLRVFGGASIALFDGRVEIQGGNPGAGKVLTSDATGLASWVTPSGTGLPSGINGDTIRHDGTAWVANNFLYNNGTNIGINDTTPVSLFTVGSGDPFQVNSSGNLVKINNVDYSWPSTQGGADMFLKNNGSGTLTWATASGGGNGWSADGTTVYLTDLADHVRIGDSTVIYKGTSTVDANRFFYAPGTPSLYNMFIGKGAGKISCNNSNCHSNVGIGEESLKSITGGWYNMAIGHLTLGSTTSGYSNIAIGDFTMYNNTTGFRNVAIGEGALNNITTGNNNVGVGFNAGPSGSGFSNTTSIGNGASATQNNMVRVGNGGVTLIQGAVNFTAGSDFRFKKNIKDLDLGLDFINNLRPVSYQMKTDSDSDGLSYGFIAQEVEKVLGGIKTKLIETENTDEAMKYMRYNDLIAPMVKAIQEQQKQIEELKKEIEILKAK